MKVIWFNGNLGNQVFYCKYKEFLHNKYPNETIKYYSNSRSPKICVEQYFRLSLPDRIDSFKVRFVFEFLGKFMENFISISIAGTHGKTTTTS